MTGKWLSASEAMELGLVNMVVTANELEAAVMEMANTIAAKSPKASATTKRLVNQGMQTYLYTALELEIGAVLQHMTTKDVKEGLAAFEEERKPVFD